MGTKKSHPADALMGIFGLKRVAQTPAEFLEAHGWTRVKGTYQPKPPYRCTIWWHDPDPCSLEPMVGQGQAVRIQKRRNERDGIKR